jgi:hypothetical protein
MTPTEFEHALDVYGADLSRWPDDIAARARALLERSAAAAALHTQARALAAALDTAFDAVPSATTAVRARVLAAIDTPVRNPFAASAAQWLRPLVFALVPLTLGFAIGVGYPRQSEVSSDLVSAVSLFAFDAYEEYPDAQ